MENAHINPIKYMNDFRYRHNMSNLLSERYRIPYKENSRAIDDKFRIIYFYQSHATSVPLNMAVKMFFAQ